MAGVNRTTGKATDLITFSRASGGTALRKISYGSELVTNGGFDADTGWTKGTGWTISGGVASFPSGADANISQSSILTVGKVYQVTFDVTAISSGNLAYYVGTSGASGTINTVGSYTNIVTATANGNLAFRSLSATGISIDNISVKEVLFDQPDGTLTLFNHPNNIPRIEYAADGTVKGLLIEESRTNLVTYSEDFTAVNWTKVRSSVSNGFGETSPLGNDAYKLLGTTDNNTHFIYVNVTATGDRVVSVFAKAAELSWLILANTGFGSLSASYNLSTGAVGTVTGFSSANAEAVGGGWYRCSAVVPSATADGSFDFVVALGSDDNTYVFVGATNEGIYIDGAQFEAGSFPTSYIPTSGATATRAADIASISVDSFGYRQDAGTVVVEWEQSENNKGAIGAVLDDGTFNNRVALFTDTVTGGSRTPGLYVTVGGVSQAALVHPAISANSENTLASVYSLNDFASSLNGASVLTDAAGSLPVVTKMSIGVSGPTTAGYLNGHIKSVKYYPRRLSNAQLQELTA